MWIKSATTKEIGCHEKEDPNITVQHTSEGSNICRIGEATIMHLIGNLVVNKSYVPIMVVVFKKSEEVIQQW